MLDIGCDVCALGLLLLLHVMCMWWIVVIVVIGCDMCARSLLGLLSLYEYDVYCVSCLFLVGMCVHYCCCMLISMCVYCCYFSWLLSSCSMFVLVVAVV